MAAKTNYCVRFFKTVVGNYGSDAEICQREVPVAAEDRESAARHGIRRFCRTERLKNWTDHADRYVVERLPNGDVGAGSRDRGTSARTSGGRPPGIDEAQ